MNRMKVLDDIQAYVLDKIDEDSAEAIKEMFDCFRSDFDKNNKEELKMVKKQTKGIKKAGVENLNPKP